MVKEIKIAAIRVGQRHRRDMGDLTALADSIRQEGLLQPIGVTDRLELVFGERRRLAYRDILKKKTILARIVDVSSILAGWKCRGWADARSGGEGSERQPWPPT
jgi:ParB-like chromosome segregation protein Spo0J